MGIEKTGALGAPNNSWEIQEVVKWVAVGLVTAAVISGFFGVSGLLTQAHFLPAGFAVINPGFAGSWCLTAISAAAFVGSCVGFVSSSTCLKKGAASGEQGSAIFEISGSQEPKKPTSKSTPKKKKASLEPDEKEVVKELIHEWIREGNLKCLWQVSKRVDANELIEVDDALPALFEMEGKASLFPLHIAALHGEKALVEFLIAQQADVNQTCSINGKEFTALDIALVLKDNIMADTLINNEATLDRKGPDGQPPLLYAVTKGNVELVEILLAKGAQKAADEKELLEMALELGNDDIAKLFIVKVDVNKNLAGYWTVVLQKAVENERIEIVRHLFDCGFKWEWASEASIIYPLHEAVRLQNLELMKLLIENGVDVNSTTTNRILGKNGDTPLHWCARHGDDSEIAKLLIKHGAKVTVQNELEETPLHVAVANGNSDLVMVFLKKDKKAVKMWDQTKNTPLHLCFIGKEARLEIAQLLIDNGANVNAKDGDANTPLHLCYRNNCGGTAIKFLIDNKATKKTYNKENKLPSQM